MGKRDIKEFPQEYCHALNGLIESFEWVSWRRKDCLDVVAEPVMDGSKYSISIGYHELNTDCTARFAFIGPTTVTATGKNALDALVKLAAELEREYTAIIQKMGYDRAIVRSLRGALKERMLSLRGTTPSST